MKLFLILGNQLFPKKFIDNYKNDFIFYMAEDNYLASYIKHHKKKILYFFSCMREYRDDLLKSGFRVQYLQINENKYKHFFDHLEKFIKSKKISHINFFEIEDKDFEIQYLNFLNLKKLDFTQINSPMFLTSREEFKSYLSNNKKILMGNFYKSQRLKHDILINKNNTPTGGKWSFDEDNRKKLPKDMIVPKISLHKTIFYKEIAKIINDKFAKNFGNLNENSIFPTNRKNSLLYLKKFIKEKLVHFGDYEDFMDKNNLILFHSGLSAPLNMGLITPDDILKEIKAAGYNSISLNNLEGFIRQIIGWREFIRGMNQNYYHDFIEKNFFNHQNKLSKHWYEGTTGIEIVDDCINNLKENGYLHHIPRLMVLANIMNLCQIHPRSIYSWFMETFIDSSDWVMVPNVYGMGLFSDGGIFATKPYICGSNYILKMSNYKRGEWCEIVDGLYWSFIEKNRNFFEKNFRLNMMVKLLDKMDIQRKKHLKKIANEFIKKTTI